MSNTEDNTYNNLKGLIKNKHFCVLPQHKDSCVIIMSKHDYVQKIEVSLMMV